MDFEKKLYIYSTPNKSFINNDLVLALPFTRIKKLCMRHGSGLSPDT